MRCREKIRARCTMSATAVIDVCNGVNTLYKKCNPSAGRDSWGDKFAMYMDGALCCGEGDGAVPFSLNTDTEIPYTKHQTTFITLFTSASRLPSAVNFTIALGSQRGQGFWLCSTSDSAGVLKSQHFVSHTNNGQKRDGYNFISPIRTRSNVVKSNPPSAQSQAVMFADDDGSYKIPFHQDTDRRRL